LKAKLKKFGKVQENFICLPDPDDIYTWWYIIFGLEDEYKGGYYLGRVVCPNDYPAKAPNIRIVTENGRFRTDAQGSEGICLSISNFHPESWNPAWKVSQIVVGLVSFWIGGEYTYGSVEHYDYPRMMEFLLRIKKWILL